MKTIMLLLLLRSGASLAIQHVRVWYGSDLHLTLSQLCQEEFFDVYSKKVHIGNYVHPKIQGFLDYKDRLDFDHLTCTFTIRKFSQTDPDSFTFTSFNSEITMDFEITGIDFLTSLPTLPVMNTSAFKQNTTKECVLGVIAIGFSLDPLIYFAILLAEKIIEKRWTEGDMVSCAQNVISFCLGKYDKKRIKLACVICKVVYLVCQTIGIILLVLCGGVEHVKGWLIATILLTVLGVICIIVWISALKCVGGSSYVWKYLEWATSLAFLTCICFWYFSLYRATVTLAILPVFLVVFVIVNILIFFLCCLKKKTDKVILELPPLMESPNMDHTSKHTTNGLLTKDEVFPEGSKKRTEQSKEEGPL